MKRLLATGLIICTAACGNDSPTNATAPTPVRPIVVQLSGTVTATGGARIAGAIVKIVDGLNAGQTTTTNASGDFLFDGLTPSNANVTANATIYDEAVRGVYVNGINRIDFIFSIPACQANNSGTISFGNRSATRAHDIVWDGIRVASGLAPGQTFGPITAAAGVAHALTFRVANTATLACANATPIVAQCERGRVITCSF